MKNWENDIHPKALKGLLELIIEKSDSNQFIVSTHSNIVARYLGSAPNAKLFRVEMKLDQGRVPTTSWREIEEKPEERIRVLEDLGYETSDFYLWKGYLILEESTAERLIRDFLIPHLVPDLKDKLRPIAAGGTADIEPRLIAFMRLFVFVHKALVYREKAWVAVDGDESGLAVVTSLKSKFKDWPPEHFKNFTRESFEKYYPARFSTKVDQVLTMQPGLPKKEAKGKLAEEVLDWALANKEAAKTEFTTSAREVLEFLNLISSKLA